VLATKDEGDPAAIRRNFAIHLSPDGFVTRVIEKPRYTSNRLKGVGLYLFDLTIFDAIRRTPRTAMRDEYELTESIQVMIDDGLPVRIADVIDDDVNVTSPSDLLAINLQHARTLGESRVIGANCSIAKGAVIEDSVIGSNVVIANPITIRRSLILDGARLDSAVSLEEVVVTGTYIRRKSQLDSPSPLVVLSADDLAAGSEYILQHSPHKKLLLFISG
jgi:NDP-sugar pyrophosphorylase family protein